MYSHEYLHIRQNHTFKRSHFYDLMDLQKHRQKLITNNNKQYFKSNKIEKINKITNLYALLHTYIYLHSYRDKNRICLLFLRKTLYSCGILHLVVTRILICEHINIWIGIVVICATVHQFIDERIIFNFFFVISFKSNNNKKKIVE